MIGTPITRDLVLLGGGHAHVEVLRRFAMRPLPGVRLTVVSREIHTPYSGMLPGLIAGHYRYDEVHIDLGPLARRAGARLYHDTVVALDLEHQQIRCAERPAVAYDVLSLDIGAVPAMDVPGAREHAIAVKPVSNFHPRFEALRERVAASDAPHHVVVVGGGAGGVELVLAACARLRAERGRRGRDAGALRFSLVCAESDVLPTHPERARQLTRAALARDGIALHADFRVTTVERTALVSAHGQRLACDDVLWVTHAAAAEWPRASGLATDAQGFIRVDANLQSISHVGVFAVGDIAAVDGYPRPKSGVFAVRQGPPLADNLRRALTGQRLRPFAPQRAFLSLISTGRRHAIASRGPFAWAGDWVWHWKDHIDRTFMRRYQRLPAMRASSPDGVEDPTMRCGGCGAKLDATVLREALRALPQQARADIVIGLGAPDDAAVTRPPPGMLAVHTVDGFRSFIDDPYTFGRIAANHCLNDIYAMGATPLTALAFVTLPVAAPAKMQADLREALLGAHAILAAADTILVGGHTAEGAELTLGFNINGYADEAALLRKSGAQVGDALVLTRPLGSGVLLAAAMRGIAASRDLEAALAEMSRSSAGAARVVRDHGATAMTDVTGFGLAGHALELARASELSIEINLERVPLYAGARELAAAGIESTLAPHNRASFATAVPRSAIEHLCFDPQTAGGLLASIPAARAAACVDALQDAGYRAACIGRCCATHAAEPRLRFA